MVDKECNLRAGVYKVQTFGTTQMQRYEPYLAAGATGRIIHSLTRAREEKRTDVE